MLSLEDNKIFILLSSNVVTNSGILGGIKSSL